MGKIKSLVAAVDGKKSYIVAIATMLYAVLVVGWGQNNWHLALPMMFSGAGLGTIRSALTKIQVVFQDLNSVLKIMNTSSSNAPANGGSQSVAPTAPASTNQ